MALRPKSSADELKYVEKNKNSSAEVALRWGQDGAQSSAAEKNGIFKRRDRQNDVKSRLNSSGMTQKSRLN